MKGSGGGFCANSRGFSLLELMVALVILQVGLLAVGGMVLRAQATLRLSETLLRAALETEVVGDSVMAGLLATQGERARPWGWVEWRPAEGGAVTLMALRSVDGDTLFRLRRWPRWEDPGALGLKEVDVGEGEGQP